MTFRLENQITAKKNQQVSEQTKRMDLGTDQGLSERFPETEATVNALGYRKSTSSPTSTYNRYEKENMMVTHESGDNTKRFLFGTWGVLLNLEQV